MKTGANGCTGEWDVGSLGGCKFALGIIPKTCEVINSTQDHSQGVEGYKFGPGILPKTWEVTNSARDPPQDMGGYKLSEDIKTWCENNWPQQLFL